MPLLLGEHHGSTAVTARPLASLTLSVLVSAGAARPNNQNRKYPPPYFPRHDMRPRHETMRPMPPGRLLVPGVRRKGLLDSQRVPASMDAPVVGRLTPFMLFYTEHRDAVKANITKANDANTNTACNPADISREICRLWQRLSPQQTKDYCLLSNLYAESLAKHGAGGGVQARSSSNKRQKDPRLPKPPVSSFMWFSRHHRAVLRDGNGELSFGEIGKAVGVLWKSADAAARRPFDDLAAEVCWWHRCGRKYNDSDTSPSSGRYP